MSGAHLGQGLSAAAVLLPSAATMLFWGGTDCAPSAALTKQQPDVLHRCHDPRQYSSIYQPQVGTYLFTQVALLYPVAGAALANALHSNSCQCPPHQHMPCSVGELLAEQSAGHVGRVVLLCQ